MTKLLKNYNHKEYLSTHNPGKRSGCVIFSGMHYSEEPAWQKIQSRRISLRHYNDIGEEISYNRIGLEVKSPLDVLIDRKTNKIESILLEFREKKTKPHYEIEEINYYKYVAQQARACIERELSFIDRQAELYQLGKEDKNTLDKLIRHGVSWPQYKSSSFREFMERIKKDPKTKRRLIYHEPWLKGKL